MLNPTEGCLEMSTILTITAMLSESLSEGISEPVLGSAACVVEAPALPEEETLYLSLDL
jgi:hypothetical protein